MKVKQMWSNMLGMIHWEKTEAGTYIEPVAVIPWEDWEKYERAIPLAELEGQAVELLKDGQRYIKSGVWEPKLQGPWYEKVDALLTQIDVLKAKDGTPNVNKAGAE